MRAGDERGAAGAGVGQDEIAAKTGEVNRGRQSGRSGPDDQAIEQSLGHRTDNPPDTPGNNGHSSEKFGGGAPMSAGESGELNAAENRLALFAERHHALF